MGERPLESNDSRASDMRLVVSDPMDEDALEDDSELFSNVPARRRDIEIVLRAAPSEAEGGGSAGIVWSPAGQGIFECRWCFLSSLALGPLIFVICLAFGLLFSRCFSDLWSEGACGP